MKSYYSLVKISPNSMSDDTLTIGIILSNGNGFKVMFSKNKTQISKSLLPTNSTLLDFLVKEIEKKINETNEILNKNKSQLFENDNPLSSSLFEYLSKYSNGILKFSKPNYISNINESSIMNLFEVFVDSIEVKQINPNIEFDKIFYQKIESKLIDRVKEKVHTKIKFNDKIVPSLFSSFEVDCIGLNGAFVGAKSLPFTQSKDTLHKNVNTYISVIAHLSKTNNKNLSDNNFFLISDQPKDKLSMEYKLWKQLFQSENLFKVISSDESELVAELIEKKNATTFLAV